MRSITDIARYGRFWGLLPDAFDRLRPETPYSADVAAVLAFLAGNVSELPGVQIAPSDIPLLEDLFALRDIVDWRDFTIRPGAARRILVSPAGDEALLDLVPATWTNLYALNHALLSAIRPSRTAAVLVTMRDDGARILEFVAHYRALGFEGIFIYSNDNNDGSERLLTLLAHAGVITFIQNDITGRVSPQRKAFEHSLRKLPELRDYRWVFYADSDEFLRLPQGDDCSIRVKLQQAMEHYPTIPPAAVIMHWKWFVSGKTFEQTTDLLLERFRHAQPHNSFKSLVHLPDTLSMVKLHFPICGPHSFFVDSNLDLLSESMTNEQQGMWNYIAPQYGGGQINHYWTKSFQEFCIKKGRGATIGAADYQRSFEEFLAWNDAETPENFDPSPPLLLNRVRSELATLRQLPGVAEAENHIQASQAALLQRYGAGADLRRVFDDLVAARG